MLNRSNQEELSRLRRVLRVTEIMTPMTLGAASGSLLLLIVIQTTLQILLAVIPCFVYLVVLVIRVRVKHKIKDLNKQANWIRDVHK